MVIQIMMVVALCTDGLHRSDIDPKMETLCCWEFEDGHIWCVFCVANIVCAPRSQLATFIFFWSTAVQQLSRCSEETGCYGSVLALM